MFCFECSSALPLSTNSVAPILVPFSSIPDVEFVPSEEATQIMLLDKVPIPLSEYSAQQQAPTHAHLLLSHWHTAWLGHMKHCSHKLLVPAATTHITTSLNMFTWRCLRSRYPDRRVAQFFLEGIQTGFRIGVVGGESKFKSAKKNLQSALEHPQVVQEYLSAEIQEHRLAGPFPKSLIPSAHISPFGVIPKSHQPDKWRLIVNLSHPNNYNVNDAIPKELCSISYVTIDDAIQNMGRNALLAKIDIKSAFQLIPVHPADRHWPAMEWNGMLLIDTCLHLVLGQHQTV